MSCPPSWPAMRILLLVLWGIGIASCPNARSQAPPSAVRLSLGAPIAADEPAAQLRAAEESNKKLVEQLERSTREHDEQIKQLLEKYRELSNRLGAASE